MSQLTEFNLLRTIDGGNPKVIMVPIEGGGPVLAGQEFTPGQVVVLNDALRVQEAKDGENAVLGVALSDARVDGTSLAEDTQVSVLLFDDNSIFQGVVTTAGNVTTRLLAGNAVSVFGGGTTYPVDLDVGAVTAGVHTIDENASADDLFIPIDIDLVVPVKLHILGGVDCQYVRILHSTPGEPSTAFAGVFPAADTL
jgi:hypothetical protein